MLAARLAVDAGGPLLTFYDDATGERVELSAATFANWVAKTANLLVDGLGLGPGSRATVDLPLHWQSLVVTAACWAAGLTVQFGPGSAGPSAVGFGGEGEPAIAAEGPGGSPPAGPADVGFYREGQPPPAADDLVVLSLHPMGGGLVGPSDGAVDYAADVLAYGDRFTGPPPGPGDAALPASSHAALVAAAAHAPGVGRRILLAPGGDPALGEALVVTAYLGILDGGSAVICRHPDPALLARRRQTERAEALPA